VDIQWVDPYAGFVYEDDLVEVSAAYQAEKLAACGIPVDAFGEHVDPSFFIGFAIHAGIKSGITAEGNINMLQALTQHRPIRLGEALVAKGCIADVKSVPRGRTLHTEVRFEDSHGEVVVTANRVSLKPDPEKLGTHGAGEKPKPIVVDTNRLEKHETYQLTPERVKRYSTEGNSIHYEQKAAEKAGFRAPLIGGGMGVHFLMAQLWSRTAPAFFHAEIYFRRPIFWDEAVTVAGSYERSSAVLALLKPEGKVGTEVAVRDLQSQ